MLTGTLEPWSESWPPSVMTVSGTAYRLRPLAPHTSVGGGSALPTPMAMDAPDDGVPPNKRANTTEWGLVESLDQMARQGAWPTPRASDGAKGGSRQNDDLADAAKRRPTPTVNGNNNKAGLSAKSGNGLATAAKTWATSQAHDTRPSKPERVGRPNGPRNLNDEAALFSTPVAAAADRRNDAHPKGNLTLIGHAARHLPTPTAHDSKATGPSQMARKSPGLADMVKFPTPTTRDTESRGPAEANGNSPGLSFKVQYPTPRANKWGPPDSHGKVPEEFRGGMLNPRWVEWLMGIPIGWTRLEPLETESYLQWWLSFCGEDDDHRE